MPISIDNQGRIGNCNGIGGRRRQHRQLYLLTGDQSLVIVRARPHSQALAGSISLRADRNDATQTAVWQPHLHPRRHSRARIDRHAENEVEPAGCRQRKRFLHRSNRLPWSHVSPKHTTRHRCEQLILTGSGSRDRSQSGQPTLSLLPRRLGRHRACAAFLVTRASNDSLLQELLIALCLLPGCFRLAACPYEFRLRGKKIPTLNPNERLVCRDDVTIIPDDSRHNASIRGDDPCAGIQRRRYFSR